MVTNNMGLNYDPLKITSDNNSFHVLSNLFLLFSNICVDDKRGSKT